MNNISRVLRSSRITICAALLLTLMSCVFAPGANAWLQYVDTPLANRFAVNASTVIYYEYDGSDYYWYGYSDDGTLNNDINNSNIVEAGYAVLSTWAPDGALTANSMDAATDGYASLASGAQTISLNYLRNGTEATYTGNVPGIPLSSIEGPIAQPNWLTVGYTYMYKFTQMYNPTGGKWAFRSGMTSGSEQVRGQNTSNLSEDTTPRTVSIKDEPIATPLSDDTLYVLPSFAKGVYNDGANKTAHAIRTPQQFQNMAAPGWGWYDATSAGQRVALQNWWSPGPPLTTSQSGYALSTDWIFHSNGTYQSTFTQEKPLDFGATNSARIGGATSFSPSPMDGVFMGMYDGNKSYIDNLVVNNTRSASGQVPAGLFAMTWGYITQYHDNNTKATPGTPAVIKDLTINNTCSFTSNQRGFAAFVGMDGNTTFENLTNNAPVTGQTGSGTANSQRFGGISGRSLELSTFTNCVNNAAISGNQNAGGIIGYAGTATLSNCVNNGAITAVVSSTASGVGGLIGLDESSRIENCQNNGTVTGTDIIAGGLVGYGNTTYNTRRAGPTLTSFGIYDSQNNIGGIVSNGGSITGGIIGRNVYIVSNCVNYASVTGNTNVGGIAGQHSPGVGKVSTDDPRWTYYFSDGVITGCENKGIVSGVYNVGGIAGINEINIAPTGSTSTTTESNSYIEISWNTGNVSGTDTDPLHAAVGGIVGRNQGVVRACALIDPGTVSGPTNVGGIVGYNSIESKNADADKGGTVRGVLVISSGATAPVSGTTNVGGIIGNGTSLGGGVTSPLYRAFYIAHASTATTPINPIYGNNPVTSPVDCYVIQGTTSDAAVYNDALTQFPIGTRSNVPATNPLTAQPYAYLGDASTLSESGGYIYIEDSDNSNPGRLSGVYWYFPGGGYPYPHLKGIPLPTAPIVYGTDRAIVGKVSDLTAATGAYTFTFETRNVNVGEYAPNAVDAYTSASVAYIGTDDNAHTDIREVEDGSKGITAHAWGQSDIDVNITGTYRFTYGVSPQSFTESNSFGGYRSHGKVAATGGNVTMKNGIELWWLELTMASAAGIETESLLSGNVSRLVQPDMDASHHWTVATIFNDAFLVIDKATDDATDPWDTIYSGNVVAGGNLSIDGSGVLTYTNIPYTPDASDTTTLRMSVYSSATADGVQKPGRKLGEAVFNVPASGNASAQSRIVLRLVPVDGSYDDQPPTEDEGNSGAIVAYSLMVTDDPFSDGNPGAIADGSPPEDNSLPPADSPSASDDSLTPEEVAE